MERFPHNENDPDEIPPGFQGVGLDALFSDADKINEADHPHIRQEKVPFPRFPFGRRKSDEDISIEEAEKDMEEGEAYRWQVSWRRLPVPPTGFEVTQGPAETPEDRTVAGPEPGHKPPFVEPPTIEGESSHDKPEPT